MSDRVPGIDEQVVIPQESIAQTKEEKEQSRAAGDFVSSKATRRRHFMRVKVHSPFHDYFDGQALSVSAVNATGPFDILPKHHNFISLLGPCEVVIRTVDEAEQKIRISGGIMHVKADQVIVFLDI